MKASDDADIVHKASKKDVKVAAAEIKLADMESEKITELAKGEDEIQAHIDAEQAEENKNLSVKKVQSLVQAAAPALPSDYPTLNATKPVAIAAATPA